MTIDSESARLLYEPLTARHADELSDALTDPRVYRYLCGSGPATSAELTAQFARMAAGPPESRRRETWLNFVVRRREGEAVGRIQATIHDGLAETGYLFGPAFWGCGYATEALRWLHDRIRTAGLAESCWATVSPENGPSIRLLERVGYEREPQSWPTLLCYDAGDLVYRATLIA